MSELDSSDYRQVTYIRAEPDAMGLVNRMK